MNINLDYYKIFNEVANTLSFSQAAKNLYISQPAISQSIANLEKQLNVQLFIRNNRRILLTNEGILLHDKVNNALSIISDVEKKINQFELLEDGQLTFGASDTFCRIYLLPVITRFKKLYPNINIKILNKTSSENIALLKSGLIDVGFVNTVKNEPTITFKKYITIHDIFVGNKKTDKVYSLKDIAKLPLVLYDKTSSTRQYLEYHCSRSNISLNPSIELGQHNLILESIKNGLGIGLVVKEYIAKDININVFELKLDTPLKARSVSYCHLNNNYLNRSTLRFLELLDDYKKEINNG